MIRNHVYCREISAEAGQLAFEAFLAQEIELYHPAGLAPRAWELAAQFHRPTVYDAFYLLLGVGRERRWRALDRRRPAGASGFRRAAVAEVVARITEEDHAPRPCRRLLRPYRPHHLPRLRPRPGPGRRAAAPLLSLPLAGHRRKLKDFRPGRLHVV